MLKIIPSFGWRIKGKRRKKISDLACHLNERNAWVQRIRQMRDTWICRSTLDVCNLLLCNNQMISNFAFNVSVSSSLFFLSLPRNWRADNNILGTNYFGYHRSQEVNSHVFNIDVKHPLEHAAHSPIDEVNCHASAVYSGPKSVCVAMSRQWNSHLSQCAIGSN